MLSRMLTQAPPKSVLNALALRAFGTSDLAYLIKEKTTRKFKPLSGDNQRTGSKQDQEGQHSRLPS